MKQGKNAKTGRHRAAVLILMCLIILPAVTVWGQAAPKGDRIAEYIASQPLDPEISAQLNKVLGNVAGGDSKLYMEISRRIDFYFYVTEEVDTIMKLFRESLIPFMYQKDLFQGNPLKGTTALIRSPQVLAPLNVFIHILQPFYAIAIMITGVYLLFISGSPTGRAKAKGTLIKLVLGLGLITLTLPLMEMLLESAHYATSVIMNIPNAPQINSPINADMFMSVKEFFARYFLRIAFFDTMSALPFLAAMILLPSGVLLMFSIRYYMVLLLAMFFPFTVFLYSFIATKRIGSTLLRQMFIWIYIQVIDGLILLVTWTAYSSVQHIPSVLPETANDVRTFIALAGFLLLIAAPLIGLWVVNWISALGLMSYILIRPISLTEAYLEKTEIREEDLEETEYDQLKDEVEK
jgi:hypothetical protein